MRILMLLLAVCMLSSCATPEGNERGRRFFKALADIGARHSQSASENMANSPKVQPVVNSYQASTPTHTQTDYKCLNECTSAGYAYGMCSKQCSY